MVLWTNAELALKQQQTKVFASSAAGAPRSQLSGCRNPEELAFGNGCRSPKEPIIRLVISLLFVFLSPYNAHYHEHVGRQILTATGDRMLQVSRRGYREPISLPERLSNFIKTNIEITIRYEI